MQVSDHMYSHNTSFDNAEFNYLKTTGLFGRNDETIGPVVLWHRDISNDTKTWHEIHLHSCRTLYFQYNHIWVNWGNEMVRRNQCEGRTSENWLPCIFTQWGVETDACRCQMLSLYCPYLRGSKYFEVLPTSRRVETKGNCSKWERVCVCEIYTYMHTYWTVDCTYTYILDIYTGLYLYSSAQFISSVLFIYYFLLADRKSVV